MEDFVNFKLAQKLKEKGFDIPCTYAYCKKGGWNKYTRKHEPITYILRTDGNPFGTYYTGENWNKEYKTNKNKIQCSAPTISQVLKWLREEKDIFIEISCIYTDYFPTVRLLDSRQTDYIRGDVIYSTYEQAALAGIEYVLDNLI